MAKDVKHGDGTVSVVIEDFSDCGLIHENALAWFM